MNDIQRVVTKRRQNEILGLLDLVCERSIRADDCCRRVRCHADVIDDKWLVVADLDYDDKAVLRYKHVDEALRIFKECKKGVKSGEYDDLIEASYGLDLI